MAGRAIEMDRVSDLVGVASKMDADAQGTVERSAIANPIAMEVNEIDPAVS